MLLSYKHVVGGHFLFLINLHVVMTFTFIGSIKQLKQELEAVVGASNVSSGESVILQHGQDEGPHTGKSPDIVVFPSSTEEVSQICKICSKHNVHIIAYGTGTGLEGEISAVEGGVCVSSART